MQTLLLTTIRTRVKGCPIACYDLVFEPADISSTVDRSLGMRGPHRAMPPSSPSPVIAFIVPPSMAQPLSGLAIGNRIDGCNEPTPC